MEAIADSIIKVEDDDTLQYLYRKYEIPDSVVCDTWVIPCIGVVFTQQTLNVLVLYKCVGVNVFSEYTLNLVVGLAKRLGCHTILAKPERRGVRRLLERYGFAPNQFDGEVTYKVA